MSISLGAIIVGVIAGITVNILANRVVLGTVVSFFVTLGLSLLARGALT